MSDKYDNEYKRCREEKLKRLSEARNISLDYSKYERMRLTEKLLEKVNNEKGVAEEADKKE